MKQMLLVSYSEAVHVTDKYIYKKLLDSIFVNKFFLQKLHCVYLPKLCVLQVRFLPLVMQ